MRVIVVDADKVGGAEGWRELLFKILAIICTNAEGTNTPDVTKNRRLDLVGKLGDKLMRHRERKFVLARLREDGCN